MLAGNLAQAQHDGVQSVNLACELTMRGEEGITLRVLGEIATAQGQMDKAKEYLDQSVDILKELGDEYQQARRRSSTEPPESHPSGLARQGRSRRSR